MSARTITVIVRDNFEGNGVSYPDPLIYTVTVDDPRNLEEVQAAVEKERRDDLGDDNEELNLDVLMAFEGDLSPVADWRE